MLVSGGQVIAIDHVKHDDTLEGDGRFVPLHVVSQGTSGTTDFNDLENKPKINDVELSGNKSTYDLNILPAIPEEKDKYLHLKSDGNLEWAEVQGGGTGIAKVIHDETLSGKGTSDEPLGVSNSVLQQIETKQEKLPTAEKNKYLHANETTGELEWKDVAASEIPIATTVKLGGVIVGNNISVDGTGKISVKDASTTSNGLMSKEDKAKLDGIASGAEKNVQSDWNETSTTSDAYIKNKPTIPKVNNASLTVKQNNVEAGKFTANASADVTIELTDTTYENATQTKDGLLSKEDKAKLDGIATGAEKNVQSDWNETSSESDAFIKNKPDIPTVNDAVLTVKQNDVIVGQFSSNASTETTIELADTTYEKATQTKDGLLSKEDKKKLDGVEAGAEKNVQADWAQTDNTEDDFIKNKPTIPTVNNASLTIKQNEVEVGKFTANASVDSTIELTDTTYGKVTTEADGLMSKEDKVKLDSLSALDVKHDDSLTGKGTDSIPLGVNVDVMTELSAGNGISFNYTTEADHEILTISTKSDVDSYHQIAKNNGCTNSAEGSTAFSYTLGKGLIPEDDMEVIVGQYNKAFTDTIARTLFAVGGGTSDADRKNAFSVISGCNLVAGDDNTLDGQTSTFTLGDDNVASSADHNIIVGNENSAHDISRCQIIGLKNSAYGFTDDTCADINIFGGYNSVAGIKCAQIIGTGNTLIGLSIPMSARPEGELGNVGFVNAYGTLNYISGSVASQIFGNNNTLSGSQYTFLNGSNNHAITTTFNNVYGQNNTVVGCGFSIINGFANNIQNAENSQSYNYINGNAITSTSSTYSNIVGSQIKPDKVDYSLIYGDNIEITASEGTTNHNKFNIVNGYNHKLHDLSYTLLNGVSNSATGEGSLINGNFNEDIDGKSLILGDSNYTKGKFTYVIGQGNIVNVDNNNPISGAMCMSVGMVNKTDYPGCIMMGFHLTATAPGQVLIGYNNDINDKLTSIYTDTAHENTETHPMFVLAGDALGEKNPLSVYKDGRIGIRFDDPDYYNPNESYKQNEVLLDYPYFQRAENIASAVSSYSAVFGRPVAGDTNTVHVQSAVVDGKHVWQLDADLSTLNINEYIDVSAEPGSNSIKVRSTTTNNKVTYWLSADAAGLTTNYDVIENGGLELNQNHQFGITTARDTAYTHPTALYATTAATASYINYASYNSSETYGAKTENMIVSHIFPVDANANVKMHTTNGRFVNEGDKPYITAETEGSKTGILKTLGIAAVSSQADYDNIQNKDSNTIYFILGD